MQRDIITGTGAVQNRPPPGARPEIQKARGGDTRGSQQTNPNYVRIVNSVENGSGVIKRKVAEHYVTTGRAEWVAGDQLRLNLSHAGVTVTAGQRANQRAAAQAATGYELAEMPAHRGDRPNLNEMRRDDRERYKTRWQKHREEGDRTNRGRGAVGYTGHERTVHFGGVSINEKEHNNAA
jgi:hypothetical protein